MDSAPAWKDVLLLGGAAIAISTTIAWALVGRIAGQVDAFIQSQNASAERAAEQRGEAKARMDALASTVEEVRGDIKTLLTSTTHRKDRT